VSPTSLSYIQKCQVNRRRDNTSHVPVCSPTEGIGTLQNEVFHCGEEDEGENASQERRSEPGNEDLSSPRPPVDRLEAIGSD
jgi:hypothetical protein